MRPRVWQALAWAGGAVGAAVTGAAVGVVAHSSRVASHRDEETETEPLGGLPPDRHSTVVSDDGTPLSVQEIEPTDGKPADLTVVLVHGFANDSRSWHFQRRDLPDLAGPRVRVVLYDQRSHGRSERSPKNRSTIEQLGGDLDAVLRATAADGPVVLVGHSMGGMAIMALAERRPELFRKRVRGIALIATSAGAVGAFGLARPWLSRYNVFTRGLGVVAGWQPTLVETTRKAGGQISWNLVRQLAFGERNVSSAMVDLTDDMINGTSVGSVMDFLDTIGEHERLASLAALRDCEVLVLSGDADRMTPFSHAETIAAELPGAQLVRVEGAGHMVMLERYETVTAELVALIRRVSKVKVKPK